MTSRIPTLTFNTAWSGVGVAVAVAVAVASDVVVVSGMLLLLLYILADALLFVYTASDIREPKKGEAGDTKQRLNRLGVCCTGSQYRTREDDSSKNLLRGCPNEKK
jgi:cytochrome c-type biogenesis protein CcmE